MYDKFSMVADDFINDDEIKATLKYADENKHNTSLIKEIIEEAKNRKGLDHRKASVLLACDIPELNQEIYELAGEIKKGFLWRQDCHVRTSLSFKLLREWLCILPVSCEEQAHCKKEAYPGRDSEGSHGVAGYGA